jgi:hypothetical protein
MDDISHRVLTKSQIRICFSLRKFAFTNFQFCLQIDYHDLCQKNIKRKKAEQISRLLLSKNVVPQTEKRRETEEKQ